MENTIIIQTSNFLEWLKSFCTWANLFKYAGSILIIFLIWLLYRLTLKGIKKIPEQKTNQHRRMIAIKIVKYSFYAITVVYILSLFGVKLSAIWGAAGIAGIAIGFAAQTSVSNLISGLFVLTEGSLKVGDTIIVDDITGVVDAISLLSVRIHTHDNQMVRIPNSTIINTSLTNNSYHDKRRMTLKIAISYDTDMQKALETLKKAPTLCPTVLTDPSPNAWFDGFEDGRIHMTVAAWFKPADFIQTKNDLYISMKKVFDEAGIKIPYSNIEVNVLE